MAERITGLGMTSRSHILWFPAKPPPRCLYQPFQVRAGGEHVNSGLAVDSLFRSSALLKLFQGIRPFKRAAALRDAFAGFTLAAMNIPQALGYTKIAGMPVVTGLYSLLLPLVGFAAFGSSRYLVVSADSATAAIFASGVSGMAPPASARYVALAGAVALLTAGFLLLARLLKLGFIADFLSQTVLDGFLTGVGFQVGIAVLGEMLGVEVSAQPNAPAIGSSLQKTAPSPSADLSRFRGCDRGSTAVSPLCAQSARCVHGRCWSHRGQRNLEFQRSWHRYHRPGGRRPSSSSSSRP